MAIKTRADPDRNMKILFIHQNFPAQFKFLAPALAKSGHEVHALAHDERAKLKDKEAMKLLGVTLHAYSVGKGSTKGIHPWVQDMETKTIRAEGCFRKSLAMKSQGFLPDVIVAHPGWGESTFIKEVWPSAKLGIYCEYYYHHDKNDLNFDPEFEDNDPGLVCRIKMKNINNEMHFKIADAGISPTEFQANTFPPSFRKKITVVHDGIDTTMAVPDPNVSMTLNAEWTLTRQSKVLTFVNRNLEPMRGYHVFMRALPEILRRNPDLVVLIVGGDDVSYGAKAESDKSWRDIFAEEVRPSIADSDWQRVKFMGNVKYQHFIPMLALSTVHVYLTYPFVLSWSLLEAMSVGCAIIASDTAPLHEVISHENNGILTDFFDLDAIVENICSLLADPEKRDRLGINARDFVVKNYDLKSVCLPTQIAWVNGLAG